MSDAPRRTCGSLVVLGAALLLALAACSEVPKPSPNPSEPPLSSFLGGTLEEVTRLIPPDIFVVIQDVSILADADPTYTAVDYGSPEWRVLALCADRPHLGEATSVEVAVIPSAIATSTMIADAQAGDYGGSVTCEDRSYRASPGEPD